MELNQTKLKALQRAGKVAAQTHQLIKEAIQPGVNLLELEKIAAQSIKQAGMKPAFLGYKGYPAVTCLSVNEEIVHGIPHDRVLVAGDTVAVDLGVSCDGWIVDTAHTHPVGTIDKNSQKLLSVTKSALYAAIEVCRAGRKIGDIGESVQSVVEQAGFFIVKELTGHGVGRTLQEAPNIPNFGKKGTGKVLEPGLVIAVEPITSALPTDIAILDDGWTIVAEPPCHCAHFEHTLIITDHDPIILTALL